MIKLFLLTAIAEFLLPARYETFCEKDSIDLLHFDNDNYLTIEIGFFAYFLRYSLFLYLVKIYFIVAFMVLKYFRSEKGVSPISVL